MINCDEYISRYTNKVGFNRNKISDKVTNDLKKIKITLIFGDLQETVLFGQTVYKNLCGQDNDYNIVVTWPGLDCFFQYADEIWTPTNSSLPFEFYNSCYGIKNTSKYSGIVLRSLNEFFLHVNNADVYDQYFEYYVKDMFINKYPTIDFKYPNLVARNNLSNIFIEKVLNMPEKKVVVMPYKTTRIFSHEKTVVIPHYESLYTSLIESLLQMNFGVFCLQNDFTFDVSRSLAHENFLAIKEHDYQKILSYVNLVGNYLDFFGNSSFVGMLSQANTFVVNDRSMWFGLKKYQEYSIYKTDFGYKNYFSFLKFNDPYNKELNILYFKNIINCLNDFLYESNLEKKPVIHKNKNICFIDIMKHNKKVFCAKPFNLKG